MRENGFKMVRGSSQRRRLIIKDDCCGIMHLLYNIIIIFYDREPNMEEHMIALVKSHPHIYDKKNRSYDANVIENIWTEIGEELGKAGYPKLRGIHRVFLYLL